MGAWITRHLQTAIGTLGRLSRQPMGNLLTVMVLGIALALPACLWVLVTNVRVLSGDWNRALELSVYLKTSASQAQAERLAERLRQRRDVAEAKLITAEQGLKEFREQSGFGGALEALTDNPLPHAIVIRPAQNYASPGHLEKLSTELKGLPEVDIVQLDTAWVQRLHAILDTARRVVSAAAVLLGIGVVVIVGNTIRLDIQNRREEIEVTKLVGGSDAFVRRPFLYSGVWYGLGGGIVAWLVVVVLIALLDAPVQRLAGLYGSAFNLSGLDAAQSLILICTGAALGWLGSLLAASRHLRDIEPT